jgi:Fe-S-cluster-containing dehydrogenase component
MPKNAGFFSCEVCDVKCSNKYNYQVRYATPKPEKFTKVYISLQKNATANNALTYEYSKNNCYDDLEA